MTIFFLKPLNIFIPHKATKILGISISIKMISLFRKNTNVYQKLLLMNWKAIVILQTSYCHSPEKLMQKNQTVIFQTSYYHSQEKLLSSFKKLLTSSEKLLTRNNKLPWTNQEVTQTKRYWPIFCSGQTWTCWIFVIRIPFDDKLENVFLLSARIYSCLWVITPINDDNRSSLKEHDSPTAHF